MSQKADRKAAKSAYAERKEVWAVIAVRIGAAVWVTLKPDAKALENRLGFMLRQGGESAPGMRAAYGEAGTLEVEVLERLDEDLSPMARERVGEERLAAWAEELAARRF